MSVMDMIVEDYDNALAHLTRAESVEELVPVLGYSQRVRELCEVDCAGELPPNQAAAYAQSALLESRLLHTIHHLRDDGEGLLEDSRYLVEMAEDSLTNIDVDSRVYQKFFRKSASVRRALVQLEQYGFDDHMDTAIHTDVPFLEGSTSTASHIERGYEQTHSVLWQIRGRMRRQKQRTDWYQATRTAFYDYPARPSVALDLAQASAGAGKHARRALKRFAEERSSEEILESVYRDEMNIVNVLQGGTAMRVETRSEAPEHYRAFTPQYNPSLDTWFSNLELNTVLDGFLTFPDRESW